MGGLSAFYCLCLSLLFLMETPGVLGQNAKPTFKAVAPNILCSNRQPTVFSINLVPGTPDLKLNYRINISYEYSMPTKTQHHSLMVWRTIRTLEQQLAAQRTSIDAENKIDIATASLTPGVIYMFDIQGESTNGAKTDTVRFILDYKDGDMYRMCQEQGTTMAPPNNEITTTGVVASTAAPPPMTNNEIPTTGVATTAAPPQITASPPIDVVNEINSTEANENLTVEVSTISISGPEKVFAHMPVMIRAATKFIGNVNEYFIQWKIDGLPADLRPILTTKGSLLTFPPYTLTSGKSYTIEADLMDASTSQSVANATHTITIERHELRASIIPANALIGVGRSIDIELKIQDYNINKGNFKIQWRCVVIEEESEAESLCDRFNDVSEPKKSIVFTKAGMYHMEAMIVNNLNLTAEVISTIEVRNDIIAKIQIDSVPKMPADVTKWIRGQASISYVVPKCVAKWSFVQKEGYIVEDISILKGAGIGELIVNDFEANFLKSMNDYSNSTVTKHVKLHIPPANAYPGWNGLKKDSKYRLRLTNDCPEPIDLDNKNAKNNSKRVESFMEFDLETNGPPETTKMVVEPQDVVALVTPVTFKINPSEDRDGPLLYSVGIEVDGLRIILQTDYDLKEMQAKIPFSESPIGTFFEVCDIYKACRIDLGSSLNTKLSSDLLTFDFSRMQLDAIESGLDRGEYNSSLNHILIVGLTLKHLPDEKIYKEFHQNIIQLIKAETKRILKASDDNSTYLSQTALFDYIQNVKIILKTFNIHDRELIEDTLSLLDKIPNTKNSEASTARDIKRRRKRQAEINEDPSNPVVDTAIELLALLPPDLSRLKQELRWMCRDDVRSRTISMTEYHTTKLNENFKDQKFKVPNSGFEWTATVEFKDLYVYDAEKEYCVGSAFNRSYFNPIFVVYVFSKNNGNQNFSFESYKEKATMDIAIQLNATVKPENVACEMLIDDKWDENVCKATQIISPKILACTCEKNEPFRMKFVKAKEITDTLTPPALTITQSMDVTTEGIQATTTKEGMSSAAPMMSPENGSSGSTLATVGYSALAILALGAVFGAISLYLYRNSKKRGNSFALDLQAIAAEARTKTPGITYARFHDEHMMQGDQVNFTTLS